MNVGIVGGTFDPIHVGHLILAQSAKQNLNLDKVLFLINGSPPHKAKLNILPASIRLDMLKIALRSNRDFGICQLELNLHGVGYSSDTLERLTQQFPSDIFHFILGSDAFLEIMRWHEPQKLLSICNIAVAVRAGDIIGDVLRFADMLKTRYFAKIRIFDSPLIEISSTKLRRAINRHEKINYLVPDGVLSHIIKNKLYLN